MINEKVKQV
ncbi:unnamed protein product, partial [Rotaria sordida]